MLGISGSDPVKSVDRFLVLLRHGIAEERRDGLPDRERRLTKEGVRKIRQIGRGIAAILPGPVLILTSPAVRCVETALRVSKAYDRKMVEMRNVDQLAPDAGSKDFMKLLGELSWKRLICVGHEPDLSELMRALTGSRGASELKKGGAYGIRFPAQKPALEWMLPPKVLRRLG